MQPFPAGKHSNNRIQGLLLGCEKRCLFGALIQLVLLNCEVLRVINQAFIISWLLYHTSGTHAYRPTGIYFTYNMMQEPQGNKSFLNHYRLKWFRLGSMRGLLQHKTNKKQLNTIYVATQT